MTQLATSLMDAVPGLVGRRPRIIAVINQKGGVGKSLVVMQLAATVHESCGNDPDHSKVLVISADPQHSVLWWAKRMKLLPFDVDEINDPRELRTLRTLTQYQYIFIDTPGSLDSEARVREVLAVCDEVLVPITPNPLDFDPTIRTVEGVVQPAGKPYTVVVNNHHSRDGSKALEGVQRFIAKRGWNAARAHIRHYRLHAEASSDGLVVTQYGGGYIANQAKADFLKLALELGYGGHVGAAALAG